MTAPISELITMNVAGDLDAIAQRCRDFARAARGDDADRFDFIANTLAHMAAGIRLATREDR